MVERKLMRYILNSSHLEWCHNPITPGILQPTHHLPRYPTGVTISPLSPLPPEQSNEYPISYPPLHTNSFEHNGVLHLEYWYPSADGCFYILKSWGMWFHLGAITSLPERNYMFKVELYELIWCNHPVTRIKLYV